MRFLYPLGLIGLIGIPILILIYIIKSKYTEQTVSSTYLWTLSERFMKKRNPISKLTGIISLLLQLLTVTFASLALASPIITVKDMAKEYCFILDASGSMNMAYDGETRFARGKAQIEALMDEAVDGSRFSLVYVGDATTVVFEYLTDKKLANELLDGLQPAYSTVDTKNALEIAQGYFNENTSVLTYFVTDKDYTTHHNVEIVNVAKGESNYAVTDVQQTVEGGKLYVTGQVYSYTEDKSLTVSLYLNGEQTATSVYTVNALTNKPTPFTLIAETDHFASIKVGVSGGETADGMTLDNEYMIFDVMSESTYNTLIVSENPDYINFAISTIVSADIDVVKPKDYVEGTAGYGLYVFDSFNPTSIPKDGSVWFINPQTGINSEAGFSVQRDVPLTNGVQMERAEGSSTTYQALTKDLSGNLLYVKQYAKCSLFRSFTTLYSFENNPLLFAGTNAYGNREAVFAFDLQQSNLPLEVYDFTVLVRNLIEFSFPDIVEKTDYYCGEFAEINVVANSESIRVERPSGSIEYLDVAGATASIRMDEVGVYTVTVTASGVERKVNLYAALAEEERTPVGQEKEFVLQGFGTKGGFDGTYDLSTVLFILLAVCFLADWGVYCYEKYQFR